MPLIIKDYNWKQTPTDITVTVPRKGVHKSKVDIFISTRFVKTSYEKYYFELILYSAIDKSASRCTLTPTEIVFELKKWEAGEWEYLEPNVSKADKLKMKKQFLEDSYEEIQKHEEKRENKKTELKRHAVKKQMELDTENRNNIESIRKMEEQKALGDLQEFKKKIAQKLKASQRKTNKSTLIREVKEPENPEEPPPEIPKTRSSTTVQIDFTAREFPTPCRESRLQEEHEFLAKQAEARRTVGFISEDIRPEERNPQFIKAKGDEFLKNKNYLGAISAYSFGIKLSKNFVDLYIARSEAHMGVENFWRAAEDCSTALEFLNPICEANLYERAVCTGRRGEALCQLNMRRQGLEELRHSLKLIDQKYYRDVLEREENILKEQEEKEKEKEERERIEREEKLKERKTTCKNEKNGNQELKENDINVANNEEKEKHPAADQKEDNNEKENKEKDRAILLEQNKKQEEN